MKIINVKYLDGYKLEVLFDNKELKVADFETFLKKAKNPSITENLEPKKFKTVIVDTGFLSWNDGEMEITAESVYKDFCILNT
jgi:hypothetical protein